MIGPKTEIGIHSILAGNIVGDHIVFMLVLEKELNLNIKYI
jgi:dihydrodipicolinate reductase